MRTKPMSYFFKLTLAVAGVCTLAVSSYADTTQQESGGAAAAETEVVSVEAKAEVKPELTRAQQRRLATISRTATAQEGFDSVEMFSAMETGEVEVIIKARSAADSNILVKNMTDRPLSVQMPKAFSAVPVLRQFGGLGGGGNVGVGGGNQNNQSQGIGGGLGGNNNGGGFGGGGGGGLGGGAFNIPPGKVGKVGVKTVCLEHGRPDPKSYIDYKIQPLDKLNDDPKIAEMMGMLANGEIAQPVAQAAAWHVTDNKSWQELLVMNRVESRMGGYFERFFTPNQLQFAQQVVAVAAQRATETEKKSAEEETSPGELANE